LLQKAPELADKIEHLTELQHRLERLRFRQYFYDLRDEVRRCARARDFVVLLKNYREMLRLLDSFVEVSNFFLSIFSAIFQFL
jgi:hypothetical protein